MKKIVVIGGGSGLFNVLKGLKHYPVELTAIVTTFDNGGSTGVLRDEFGILPPGDIRRCLVALAPETGDSTLRDLFNFRFAPDSSLRGHSFGNLFLQALADIAGGEIEAIKKVSNLLNIGGSVLPVSIDDAHVMAELSNGQIIKGETNIDIPKHDGALKIKRVYLEPEATIYREAYLAIVEADLLVIGPGDLYTSIVPNLLVRGFGEALGQSQAKTVYILNIMTKWGETNNFQASNFVESLLSYLGREQLDYLIVNNAEIGSNLIKKYKNEKAELVGVDLTRVKKYIGRVIEADIVSQGDIIRHDAKKLARLIIGL